MDVSPVTDFKLQFRQSLENSGLSHRDFAKKCGFSHSLVRNMLLGISNPNLKRLQKMAKVLGLEGVERDAFLGSAQLANSPDEVVDRLAYLEKYASNRAAAERRAYFMASALIRHFIPKPRAAEFLERWDQWPEDEQGAQDALRTLLGTSEK